MRLDAFKESLISKNIQFKTDVPMSAHTTFKIGGNADVFVIPENAEELKFVLCSAKKSDVPYFILGKGSDILVSDKGIEGAVIDMSHIGGINISGEEITCGAGESLYSLCTAAGKAGLSGLEFAYGIPGSVGGAFYMNAGAYGGEIKDVAVSCRYLDENFEEKELSALDMHLSYRSSVFQKSNYIILSVKIKLQKGDKDKISALMEEIFKKRIDKQPLDFPSAGSTFKRPEGYFAGTLIDESGLKGESFGKAQVSKKHAGFIVNTGGATASDVLNLIKKVKDTVKEKHGVELEPEVIFIGRR